MPKRVVVNLDVMRELRGDTLRGSPGEGPAPGEVTVGATPPVAARKASPPIPCVYLYHPLNDGVATLREIAAFEMFCRKCELACCIEVCPRQALEKDESGVLRRANLRCVGCMSCSRACPFGTILEEALRFHAGGCDWCDSLGGGATPGCVEACSSGALEFREVAEDEEGVVLVGERMAVKGARWLKIQPPPKKAGAKK